MTSLIKEYDFIRRTQEILDSNYDGFKEQDREVTFLLNCLLGLLITVSEREKKEKVKVFDSKIDSAFLALVPTEMGFVKDSIKNKKEKGEKSFDDRMGQELTETKLTVLHEKVDVKVGHKDALKQQKKNWYIDHVRNGIAHQNIEAISHEGKWVGIKLWNINPKNRKDFEIKFTIDELRKFAIYISNEYLQAKALG